MKIHLVGGFSGSGKTTAIASACKILADKNITVSIIKDDQVDYVVDTRPSQKFGVPFAKVTGGCFCCNYNQLDFQIDLLKKESNPLVVFAEYSGSCTNLITTLLKPLLEYKRVDIDMANFSTFVDAQLLLNHLQGAAMTLSVEGKYIWERHIQEAEILIVNKTDLLSKDDLEALRILVKDSYPSKQALFQNSLDKESINNWIETISKPQSHEQLPLDYDQAKYNESGTNLAWLDEEIELITKDDSAVEFAYNLMNKLSANILHKKLLIEHLQFFLTFNDKTLKLSHTKILDEIARGSIISEKSNSVDLLVNASVHTSPDELRKILFEVLNQFKSLDGVTIKEKFISYFQP
jgi:G3E family GTPase